MAVLFCNPVTAVIDKVVLGEVSNQVSIWRMGDAHLHGRYCMGGIRFVGSCKHGFLICDL